MTKPRLRDLPQQRYRMMVEYKAISSPICVGQSHNKEQAIAGVKDSKNFKRVWVVDMEDGTIVWERRMK
jgi:hypothetical protein